LNSVLTANISQHGATLLVSDFAAKPTTAWQGICPTATVVADMLPQRRKGSMLDGCRSKPGAHPHWHSFADRGPAEDALLSAAISFRLFAAYDRLRLSLYRDKGPRDDLISIASIGSATLLRFEDVGYFNRVYAHDDDVADRLESVERFFRGSPHGCRLVAPTLSATGTLASACESRGWLPDEEYAWLAATNLPPRPNMPGDFEIRPPRADERELFLYSYLAGFGSDPARRPMAVENMRHLFSVPDLHFLFALQDGRPAGVGMMYRTGRSALFCAGATLPSHRGQGCHGALLSARIRLAHDLGCTSVYAWAFAGGQSQANMESFGLRTVSTTLAWRFPPDRVA
jgi:GNAT superfamily N-acetyltransferase